VPAPPSWSGSTGGSEVPLRVTKPPAPRLHFCGDNAVPRQRGGAVRGQLPQTVPLPRPAVGRAGACGRSGAGSVRQVVREGLAPGSAGGVVSDCCPEPL